MKLRAFRSILRYLEGGEPTGYASGELDVVIHTPDGGYWNVSDASLGQDAEGDTVFLITMAKE